jgi:hypothetical protein
MLISDGDLSATRTVVETENRLYEIKENLLEAAFNDDGKSMIRRQDINSSYKVFSTDVFRFKGNDFGVSFLGNQVAGIKSNKICGLDIDDIIDFNIVKSLIENSRELVNEYLPKSS